MVRVEVLNCLREIQLKYPKIILFSSHIIEDIVKVASKIIVINNGRIASIMDVARQDTVENISEQILPFLLQESSGK